MAAEPAPFRRLLLRLDARTRREFCGAALREEAKLVAQQLRACAAALAQARQVAEATRRLAAGGSRSVRARLAELTAVETAVAERVGALLEAAVGEEQREEESGKQRRAEARAVVRELEAVLLAEKKEEGSEAADRSVALLRRFLELMPEDAEKHEAFWTERARDRVVRPVLRALAGEREARPVIGEVRRCKKIKEQLKDARNRLPYAVATLRELESEVNEVITRQKNNKAAAKVGGEERTPSKSKKRRLQEDESSSTPKPTSTTAASANVPRMAIKEIRAALSRCTRDAKHSEREFTLSAFDATLKRLVDVVGSLSAEFTLNDSISLTTALFAIAEQVGKINDVTRRRDRLVCLEGLFKVIIENTDIPLPAQRRTMAQEYLQNCQKSIQLLDRGVVPSPSSTKVPTPAKENKSKKRKKKDKQASSHVHFD